MFGFYGNYSQNSPLAHTHNPLRFVICNFTDDVWTKKNFSTFSYKLVQISPIMILVNSGAFLSISSWFCELTELIFVMIPYISSTGYPPKTQGIMGHVQVANKELKTASSSYCRVKYCMVKVMYIGTDVVLKYISVICCRCAMELISYMYTRTI